MGSEVEALNLTNQVSFLKSFLGRFFGAICQLEEKTVFVKNVAAAATEADVRRSPRYMYI